jgi:hypothetical protein
MVETQEHAATTQLVDDLDEQFMLEQMLDATKPNYRDHTAQRHYLISTPFRYPPLQHGSRFGDMTMPSYFYASESVEAMLAEFAFYRFVFFHDMASPYPGVVNSAHHSFAIDVNTQSMADLTRIDDLDIHQRLISPVDYSFTQQLGKMLIQQHNVDVLRFDSARCTQGVNVAIAEPDAITSTEPKRNVHWKCQTDSNKLSISAPNQAPIHFQLSDFLVEGALPRLA